MTAIPIVGQSFDLESLLQHAGAKLARYGKRCGAALPESRPQAVARSGYLRTTVGVICRCLSPCEALLHLRER